MPTTEQIEAELRAEFKTAGLDPDGPPYSGTGDGEWWPIAAELAHHCAVRISALCESAAKGENDADVSH